MQKKIISITFKKFLFFALLFLSNAAIAQKQLADYVVGKGTLNQIAGTSTTLDIRITFTDETMVFDGSNINNTCVLVFFNINDNKAYELPIISVVTASITQPLIRVNITGFSGLNGSVTGQGIIYKKNSSNSIIPYISGITPSLQQIIQRATVLDIEKRISNIFDTSRVYQYIGNGIPPALTPPAISRYAVSSSGDLYNWDYTGSLWLYVGQILNKNAQTIVGNKTFTDSVNLVKTLTASGGINSSGVINSSGGINSSGSSTTASITITGVVSQRDTLVNANSTLNGNYNSWKFDCTSGNMVATLPTEAGTIGWIFTISKNDNSANSLTIKKQDGTVLFTYLSKNFFNFQNNGVWSRK